MNNNKILLISLLFLISVNVFCGCADNGKYYSEVKEEWQKEPNNEEKKSILKSIDKAHNETPDNCNMVNGGYVVSDGEYLYYSVYKTNNKSELYKCSKDLANRELVLTMKGKIDSISIDGNKIYFSNKGLYRVNADGSDLKLLVEDDSAHKNQYGTYINKGWLYYCNKYRLKLDGDDTIETVYDSLSVRPMTLNYYNDEVYFSELNPETQKYDSVSCRSIDNDNKRTIVDHFIDSFIVYDDYIYYPDIINDVIYRSDLDGSNMEEFIHTQTDPSDINASDGWLYMSGSTLKRINIETKEEEILYDDEKNGVYHILIIDGWVYFKRYADGGHGIYRIKCDGGNAEKIS